MFSPENNFDIETFIGQFDKCISKNNSIDLLMAASTKIIWKYVL